MAAIKNPNPQLRYVGEQNDMNLDWRFQSGLSKTHISPNQINGTQFNLLNNILWYRP